jgi:hypothetical protein
MTSLEYNVEVVEIPLTYLCFSSSFICSARSRTTPFLGDVVLEFVPFEVTTLADNLDLLPGPFLSAEADGTINGEIAIFKMGKCPVARPSSTFPS